MSAIPFVHIPDAQQPPLQGELALHAGPHTPFPHAIPAGHSLAPVHATAQVCATHVFGGMQSLAALHSTHAPAEHADVSPMHAWQSVPSEPHVAPAVPAEHVVSAQHPPLHGMDLEHAVPQTPSEHAWFAGQSEAAVQGFAASSPGRLSGAESREASASSPPSVARLASRASASRACAGGFESARPASPRTVPS